MHTGNRKYYYLITEPPKNVVMSQIIEFAESLSHNGLRFDVIFLLSLKDYINNYKLIKSAREIIKQKLKKKPEFYMGFFRKSEPGLITAMIILYLRLAFERNVSLFVFHARGGYSSNVLLKLGRFNRRVKYIYDIRGDNIAEYEYLMRENKISNEKFKHTIDKIALDEKILCENAAHLFCVSNVLKEKILANYKLNNCNITVVPCLADSGKFYFDLKHRDAIRQVHGFDGKFVIVYPGGIGRWHNTDIVFQLVSDILERFENTHFVVLTPDTINAQKYAEKYLPDGRYLIRSAPRNEMPGYLMAADMGLLLRENHPLNQSASPTKFAEYMLTGLPVMISENVGDYSSFVREMKTGLVIENACDKEEYLNKFGRYMDGEYPKNREEIAALGAENFSKSRYLAMMKAVYTSVKRNGKNYEI